MKEPRRRASTHHPVFFSRVAVERAAMHGLSPFALSAPKRSLILSALKRSLALAACALLFVLCAAATARAATFTVNSASDVSDRNPGDGICRSSNATGSVCSLRAAIEEADALAGSDTINFSIATGSLTGGVAVINVVNGTLTITETVTIDGATQTTNRGDTNPGSLGVGGTVGTGNLTLSTVSRPEVQVANGANPATAVGFDIQAGNCIIRGLSIYGFGTASNSDTSGNIRISAGSSNTTIERNFLGLSATAANFNTTGVATSVGDNIRVTGGDSGLIQNNLIGHSNGKGIQLGGGSNNWTVTNNEVRDNGITVSNLDGIDIENGSGGETITGNLFIDNEAMGVDSYQSSGANLIDNNTIRGNGVGAGANVETAGVRLYGVGNTVRRNIITLNYGAGVQVTASSTANTITQNSISANGTIRNKAGAASTGQIGIDLLSATDNENTGTSPYVTINDSGDADAGGNGLLNFPVISGAVISGTNLTIAGYARPGSAIEFFIAAQDPRGFGEGLTYLFTLNEGSASDADATTGAYTSPLGGLTVGADNTNRFKFTIAIPAGVAAGTVLTATATSGASTSEFSNIATVANAPSIALCKTLQGQPCPPISLADRQPGTDLIYVITFTNSGGLPANSFVLTDPDTATTLKINDNADFKVGSVTNNLGSTGLTATVAYSNDGGATFAYTPASGAGGAPAGYDRNVTHIRWSFTGNLSQTSPNNTGSVSFTARIR